MEPVRRQRIETVLGQRIDSVRCAIEALHHRHNVSAVLRSCDALGLSHVHLVEGHFTPSKGTTRGAERWLALHRHPSPEHAIEEIRAAGFAIWIADFAEPPVAPEQVPVDRPICLWFGAELIGVGAAARAAADGVVTIPMRGFAQSLNVSVAAAVTLRAVAERSRQVLGERALLTPAAADAFRQEWLARELAIDAADDARDRAFE